jgi:predicted transposase YdaD
MGVGGRGRGMVSLRAKRWGRGEEEEEEGRKKGRKGGREGRREGGRKGYLNFTKLWDADGVSFRAVLAGAATVPSEEKRTFEYSVVQNFKT